MLAFISFLLVCIGCINWFCIGILQFDFVAGIFGSQSNIFSRLIYTLVGIASIIMIVNFITNKGKFVVSFKKANKDMAEMKEEKTAERRKKALATESAEEFSLARALTRENEKRMNTESGSDMAQDREENEHKCNCDNSDNCECDADRSKTSHNTDNKQV